jgi:hypothetical protein
LPPPETAGMAAITIPRVLDALASLNLNP